MPWYTDPWTYAMAAVNPMAAASLVGTQEAAGASGTGLSAAWKWGQERPTAPQMGANPYQGQWNSLIGQLQQQGTPLSDQAYKTASDQSMNQAVSMSRGGSAGQARQAGMNLGQSQANIAQGYQQAKLQEEMARRQALMGALGGAGNAWWQPAAANFQATVNTPSNMQMLTNFLSQGAQAGGMLMGKPPTGGGGGGSGYYGGNTGMGDNLMNPWAH